MIGIIGAMDEEVAQIVEVMQVERKENKACMTFMAGKLNGKDVVVVRSGIGKVNAAVCTQILVDDFNADYVINTGIEAPLVGFCVRSRLGTMFPLLDCGSVSTNS